MGSIQATLDGSPLTDFSTDKARALLAFLVVEAERPHRRETLAGLLWPDQPERKAAQNLRQALLHLRQTIGDGQDGQAFLCVTRETIQFNRESDHSLDASAFAALIETCKSHRHRRIETCRPCLHRLAQAIQLYRGEFLEQFSLNDSAAFEEWAMLKREWLHRQAIHALTCLSDDGERRGDLTSAREYAWRQVKLDPWREEAHRQLMRLLALAGERSAALAQYEACRRMLQQELTVEPTSETTALYERIRAGTWKPSGREIARPEFGLLGAPTPFVGREQELAELAELLANPEARLVTLVGPGGSGKTRLAQRAAQDQVGGFEHGIRLVPLTAVPSAELVAPSIADVLGLPLEGSKSPQAQVIHHLRDKEMLLVLDSLEHVVAAGDLVAEIVRRAPGVTVLATSRERLNLQEEWVYQVEGLAESSALALFEQRARQAQRRFALTPDQAPHAARICHLVAGMPLGIELAAAWVTARSCAEIAREIERNLDILTTSLRNVADRHQSMRATLDYSWGLLTEPECRILPQLAVFRGGFQPGAAERVAGATVEHLAALVDKSLLRRTESGRFEMHELVRQYALEKLGAGAAQVHTRHSMVYAAFLHGQEPALHNRDQPQARQAIHAEIENVRAAWRWAVEQRMAAQLAESLDSLHWFYDMVSWFHEAQAVFEPALAAVETWPAADDEQRRLLARLGVCLGGAWFRLGRYDAAREVLQTSITRLRALDERAELAFGLITLGHVALYQRGRENAQQCYEEALALHRALGHARGMVEALNSLGVVLRERGQYASARQALEQALALGREINNRWRVSFVLNNLGIVARMMGDPLAARTYYQESLALKREFGDVRGAAISLNNLGNIACALNEFDEALRLHHESMAQCRQIGDQMGVARSLNNLGMVAHGQGRYGDARRYHEQSLALKREIGDQRGAIHSFIHLGEASVELGDDARAGQELARALRRARDMQATPLLLDALAGLADLFARQDDTALAADLAAAVLAHPASEQQAKDQVSRRAAGWNIALPPARPLDAILAELESRLPPEAAATQSG